jgi:hypothetical protein
MQIETHSTEKRRRSPVILAFAVLFLLYVPISCRREGRLERVSFPPTPVLTIRSTWAVVKSALLRMREEPSNKSKVMSHIRMGVVVEVIAKSDNEETLENETASWYRINYGGMKGWVFGSYLQVFDSHAKAVGFAEKLK